MFEELASVLLGTLPLVVIVVAIVESLKVFEVVGDNGSVFKAAVVTGATLGVLGLAADLFPPAASYIQRATFWGVAGLTSGLAYKLGGKAIMARIGATFAAVFGYQPAEEEEG